MKKMYITITGLRYYFGSDFIKPGMKIKLVKEPDNEVDAEAIKAEMRGLGVMGYVANSPYTVLGESMSAGRIYDKIGNEAEAVVKYILPQGILCAVNRLE